MIESTREVCSSVKEGGKNLKSVWWNDEVKATVQKKEAAWKMLAARYEEAKERCMGVYTEEKRKVKRFIYRNKKKVNDEFGRKMNQDVNGNRKLF